MATGTAVSTGDIITAAKMNLKQEDFTSVPSLTLLDNSGAGANQNTIQFNETETAARTLNLKLNNANRQIDLSGDLTLAAAFTTATAAITLTANGAGSSVTLPASGTLATLAGSEQFTNKTIAGGTLSGTFTCAATVVNFTTGSITFTTGNITISGAGYISLGANPAAAGYLRLPNAVYITARNAAAGGDINMIQVSANDYVKLGTTRVEIATANMVTLIFSNPAAARAITFADPGGDDSVVYLAATQTLTGKTINGATFSGTIAGTPTFSGATITFTGNLMNFTAGGAYTLGTTDAQTLILKTGGSTRWTWAAASSSVTLAGAADIIAPANTAVTFRVTDGTTAIISLDSRNTVTGVVAVTLSASAPTIASAAGDTFSVVSIPAVTSTWTGTTGIDALNGLALNIAQPVATNVSAGLTAAVASTVYIANAPSATGNLSITTGYALHVAAGANLFGGAVKVGGVLTLTNATFNITAGGAFTLGTTDVNTVALKTSGTTRWTLAAASGNLTAAGASDIIVLNTTANVFRVINVAGTLILAVNSQTATDNVVAFTLTGAAPTFASAAGSTYSVAKVSTITVTLTGGVGVTAMSGLSLYLDAPTVTSAAATAVVLASTLYVAAPVAAGAGPASFTASYSGHFASAIRVDGNVSLANAAYDIIVKADTAAALEISDATNKLMVFDSRTTTDNVEALTIKAAAPTLVSANGTTFQQVQVAALTITLTGGVQVTAMSGIQLYLDAPTVTSANATTIVLASTLYVAAPVAAGAGPASFTAAYSAHFASQVRIDGDVSLANAAYDIVVKANTAACLEIYDATTKLLIINDQTGADNVAAFRFDGSPTSFASANGTTYRLVQVAAHTATLTGGTGVTAMSGLGLYIDVPTVTSADATTVTLGSNLYVAAPVGAGVGGVTFTAGYSAHFASQIRVDGNLVMNNAAYDLVIKAATAVALELSDGTNKLLAVDTRIATDNVEVHTWTAPAPTFASAAGSTWIHHNIAPVTITLTGGTGVTAMNGLQLYLDTPTLTSAAATTITSASTLHIRAPAAAGGGPAAITNNYMITTGAAGCFLTAAGVWTDACSIVHKTDVKVLNLRRIPELLKELDVVSYHRRDLSDGGFERFGVIAEDAPDYLATITRDGVAPQYMAGFALAAIKYLQAEKERLEVRIAELEHKIYAS